MISIFRLKMNKLNAYAMFMHMFSMISRYKAVWICHLPGKSFTHSSSMTLPHKHLYNFHLSWLFPRDAQRDVPHKRSGSGPFFVASMGSALKRDFSNIACLLAM